MPQQTDKDIATSGPEDLERTPMQNVNDLRPAAKRKDRSAHRAHTWLYDDLLA
jgi:hypothetical protein